MMEAQDTVEITTPNGHEVVIRNYTTHGDDLIAQRIVNEGIIATTNSSGEPSVQVSVSASTEAEHKYVELLVQTIDGKAPELASLRSEDYAAIAEKVKEITSPKGSSKS